MVKKLKDGLEKLQKVKEFKEFKKKNHNAYLASCVIIVDGKNIGDLQIDYYIPKKHKMATFIIKEKIELKGEDDIFQKEKSKVNELKLEEIKVGLDKMLKLLEDFRKEKYSGDFPNKIIAVLQSLDGKATWNITCLTATLKILNIKLDAKTGKVLEDKLENVFSLKASAS